MYSNLHFFTKVDTLAFILPINVIKNMDLGNGKILFTECNLGKREVSFVLSEGAKANLKGLEEKSIGSGNFKCLYRQENNPNGPCFGKVVINHIEFIPENRVLNEGDRMRSETENTTFR